MAKTKTQRWDVAQYLETDEDVAAYLEAALEEGDTSLIAAALGDIVRAKGMTEIARQTGLGRESLYKALSPEGNPEFSTVLKVIRALGLKLHAKAEYGVSDALEEAGVLEAQQAHRPDADPLMKQSPKGRQTGQ